MSRLDHEPWVPVLAGIQIQCLAPPLPVDLVLMYWLHSSGQIILTKSVIIIIEMEGKYFAPLDSSVTVYRALSLSIMHFCFDPDCLAGAYVGQFGPFPRM